MKVWVKEGSLGQVVFTARKLENGSAPEGPKWGAEERSPEAGKRKRKVKTAVQQMQAAWPAWDARFEGYRQL